MNNYQGIPCQARELNKPVHVSGASV